MQAKLQSLLSYSRNYMVIIIGFGLALVIIGGVYVFHKINTYETNAVKHQSVQIPNTTDPTQ